jgi:hypothetical protein
MKNEISKLREALERGAERDREELQRERTEFEIFKEGEMRRIRKEQKTTQRLVRGGGG